MHDNDYSLNYIWEEQIIQPQFFLMTSASSWNRHMGVKGGLNNKKRQDIEKIARRHYHLF